jgi:hypothetical protein
VSISEQHDLWRVLLPVSGPTGLGATSDALEPHLGNGIALSLPTFTSADTAMPSSFHLQTFRESFPLGFEMSVLRDAIMKNGLFRSTNQSS